jgi:hypothetical protein
MFGTFKRVVGLVVVQVVAGFAFSAGSEWAKDVMASRRKTKEIKS